MVQHPMPLPLDDLLAHARAAARSDERRHSAATSPSRSAQHALHTVRGWGGAALMDLEWTSQHVYPKAEKDAYRSAYAEEYQQQRLTRTAGQGV